MKLKYGTTSYNRTVTANRRSGLGYAKRSRAAPFVRFVFATFFGLREMLRISYISNQKTSVTAGTLCDSFAMEIKILIMF
jgi:hypothetical protein